MSQNIKQQLKPANTDDDHVYFDDEVDSDEFEPTNELLINWKALDFEKKERPRNWYIAVFVILVLLVAYALFTSNLLMSILFILFGAVLYLYEKKQPQLFDFAITQEGVIAHNNLYEFDSLDSFWIFYEPGGKKILSLKSKKNYIPYIHIPLGNINPVEVRELLLDFIPEEKQDESLIDMFERFF